MEREVGEVFKYNNEYYQCIESDNCSLCSFYGTNCKKVGTCIKGERTDKKFVIYKKLEKIGEPYSDYYPSGRIIAFQRYKCYQKPIYTGNYIYWADGVNIGIEIKQNKEDMKTVKISKDDLNFLVNKIRYGILPKCTTYDEITNEISNLFSVEDVDLSNSENIGKNLKPFDLQAAKSGKPVCTRDGRKARIICFDMNANSPIVALVDYNGQEVVVCCHNDGRNYHAETTYNDLMMLSEKKEGWVNIYKDPVGKVLSTQIVFSSEETAKQNISSNRIYISTVKIEWYE